ncbi:hypothetical protein CDEF62S_04810 [Castellaniella defragrans]
MSRNRAHIHRRIVDWRDIEGDGVRGLIRILSTVGRAAVILHLEGEARVIRTVRIGRWREHQLACVQIRHIHALPGSHRHAIQREHTRRGQCGDDDRLEGIPFHRITEPKVRGRQRIWRVLIDREGVIHALWRVVHRVHRHRGGGRLGHAGIGLGRIGKARLPVPVRVGGKRELAIGAQRDRAVSDVDGIARVERRAVDGRDRLVRALEAVVGEDVHDDCRIFVGCRGVVGDILHRRHVHRDGVRRRGIRPAVGRAAVVLHLEGEIRVIRAVRIGGRCEYQLACGKICCRNTLAGSHRHAVERQCTCCGQAADHDGLQAVAVCRVAEAEVGRRKYVRTVFGEGEGLVGRLRRIVDRVHLDRKRRLGHTVVPIAHGISD